MTDPYAGFSTRSTPQAQAIPGRESEMKVNHAGGYVFQVSDPARLRRFLMLGSDGATYYQRAPELTRENAGVVLRMAETDPQALRDTILEVSLGGRAPRQNATLFALAIACSHGDEDARRKALDLLSQVARTGTHLFLFARYVEQFRGWGRGLRRAVAEWYTEKDVDKLAYQAVKYQQRDGWSHWDMLRLSHPETVTPYMGHDEVWHDPQASLRATFDWIARKTISEHTPALIEGFTKLQTATPAQVPALVREYRLSWEMLPDEALSDVAVWDALLDNGMPITALFRQLPRLTRLGVVAPMGGGRTKEVCGQLVDPARLIKGRVHPVNVLVAGRTYESGRSDRGSSTWQPVSQVVDALDAAFYAAYGAVEPTGKRQMLALDVSGSMAQAAISNMPITPREASAALALVQTAVDPDTTMCVGFTSRTGRSSLNDGSVLMNLPLTPRQRLGDATRLVSGLAFGATDCALPMQVALGSKLEVDQFVVYTDNETGSGWGARNTHPAQALEAYRQGMGIDAKLVVVAMTATDFSIADPKDPGMLDVVGFDSAVPNLIADFARG